MTTAHAYSHTVGMDRQNLTGSAHDAELITTAEAAAMIPGCNEQTVRRWAKAGRLPVVQLPSGKLLFRRGDIEELLVPRFLTSERSELPGQRRLPV